METDAPHLAPLRWRGKRCELAFCLAKTAEVLAAVKGVGVEEIAAATTANFHRLFAKVAFEAVEAFVLTHENDNHIRSF